MKNLLVFIRPCNFLEYTRRFHYEALSKYIAITIIPLPYSFFKNKKGKITKIVTKQFGESLRVIANTHWFPLSWLRNKILSKLCRIWIKKQLNQSRNKDTVIILTTGTQILASVMDVFRPNPVIFELTDAHWLSEQLSLDEKKEFSTEITEIMPQCVAVFCSSEKLTNFALGFCKKAYYVPNTAKFYDHISFKEPGKELVFGFIGNINEWIDIELIEEIVRQKLFKLKFIGDVNGTAEFNVRFNKLVAEGAIIYESRVKNENLQEKISEFDVCLIPYRKGEYQSYIFPNKLIQYFSCGKPVISTNFSNDLKWYREATHIANSNVEFIQCLKQYTDGAIKLNEQRFHEIRELAFKNSADERAKLRLKIIEGL